MKRTLEWLAEVLSGEYAGTMKAYSTDLRERVIKAAKEGIPQEEIAKVFAISVSTIKRYLKQWRETTSLEARPIPGRPSKKLRALEEDVSQLLAAAPDGTLQDHCQNWQRQSGMSVSISTMSRAIRRAGWTRKKRRWGPANATRRPVRHGERK